MSGSFTEDVPSNGLTEIAVPRQFKEILTKNGFDADKPAVILYDGSRLTVMKPVEYALKEIQEGMAGKAESAGFRSVEDSDAFVLGMRRL
ncbi:MAG: hypothetical protein IKE69_00315 [Thermoguttaceae bacterium]|nr:hypothetical protein [Thermoguttaceae bacterium]